MSEVFRITDEGRAWEHDGDDPRMILYVEVAKRLARFVGENIEDLCEELTQKYGSVEDAVVAVKSGIARFEVLYEESASDGPVPVFGCADEMPAQISLERH